MAHDVIMPALGMAQETGLILTWHKKPGDAVAAGDVLMEVETDKAAMEVEAQADGFLSELRAQAGEEVPVGTVIAVIADSKEAAQSAPEKEATIKEPVATPAPQPAPPLAETGKIMRLMADEPAKTNAASNAEHSGNKILASPKARRLAAERGIQLDRLTGNGVLQPIRAADLDRAEAVPEAGNAPTAFARLRARANVGAEPFDRFCMWLSGESAVAAGTALAAFAASSFRDATTLTSVCVLVSTPRASSHLFADPDLAGLTTLQPDHSGRAPDLIVHDLTGSRLLDADLSAASAPTLTVGRDGDRLTVTLAAEPAHLDDDALIMCLDGFAARLEDPLRQLL